MQAALAAEKQNSANLEKKYAQSQDRSEDLFKKLEDSEDKIQQLQDCVSRLVNSFLSFPFHFRIQNFIFFRLIWFDYCRQLLTWAIYMSE